MWTQKGRNVQKKFIWSTKFEQNQCLSWTYAIDSQTQVFVGWLCNIRAVRVLVEFRSVNLCDLKCFFLGVVVKNKEN